MFTPTSEVDLCGHATLASSHVLWEVHGVDAAKSLEFHTLSGTLSSPMLAGVALVYSSTLPISTSISYYSYYPY